MRDPEATVAPRRTLVRSHMVLVAIAVVFLIARSPTMLRQAGALDEDFFAMPGWTAATEGIPRLPIYPSRDRLGNFYKADVALFTLPPAFFYWQAPWHLAIGPGYSAARFGSATAGIISLWLVYALGRRWYGCELTALVAAGLLSCSRYFFFPATTARPDMLCTMLCLAAYWGMTAWSEDRRGGWAAFAGAFSSATHSREGACPRRRR